MDTEEIYKQLVDILEELFEVDPATVTMKSHFDEDLEIDSIDAVDLMVRLQEISGHRVEPEEFKSIRTIEQCVIAVQKLYAENEGRTPSFRI